MMRILHELNELVAFVLSLWGVLTLASAFLPIVNQATKALAIPAAHAGIATGLASLTCLFAFLYAFAERHRLHSGNFRPALAGFGGFDPDSSALRSALERFGMSMALLAAYMILNVLYERLATDRGDVQQFIYSVMPPILLICYCSIFGLLTAAFGELAVIEHVRGKEAEAARRMTQVEPRR